MADNQPNVKRVLPLDGSCQSSQKKQHSEEEAECGRLQQVSGFQAYNGGESGIPSTRQMAAAAETTALQLGTSLRSHERNDGINLSQIYLGNGYDAVLSESEDLLQAIVEAQALGRLRMSSSYLTLLHARLVGLGKRFDKANSSQEKATVTRELSDMMPHVEFDTAMMEHLAKAAEELHNARCGMTNGKKSSTNEVRALFASQLKSKLQERAAPESPRRPSTTNTGEAMSPLPNCNARDLLAVVQPNSQPEDAADAAEGEDVAAADTAEV